MDLNGDGNPDIIANTCDSKVGNCLLEVFLGNGGTSFRSPVSVAFSQLGGFRVALGDINGDGKPDLVAASITSGLLVFLGNGDGTFRKAFTFTDLSGDRVPQGFAIADLNGDGKPDLAYTISGEQSVIVALGKGDGTFGSSTAYAAANVGPLAVADVNGDGFPDIVTGGISILFGDGKGGFPTRRDYWHDTSDSIILADFDGDGKIDIIVGSGDPLVLYGASVSVLFGRGGGFFSGAPVSGVPGLTPGVEIGNIVAADFNHDGILDVAFHDYSHVVIMQGTGDGNFAPSFVIEPNNETPEAIATADFNNDGKPDLVVVGNQINVHLGQGDGTFRSPISAPAPGSEISLVAGDLNGDGKQDLALLVGSGSDTSSYAVLVYLGDGNGGFSAPVSYPVGSKSTSLKAGDFNGDGKPDLAIAGWDDNGNENVSLLRGKGDGTFSDATIVAFLQGIGTLFSGAGHLAVADFNRDGKLDIAVTWSDEIVRVMLGKGDGTFQAPVLFPCSGVYGLLVADLNGDSIPDLIAWGAGVAAQGAGDVYLLGNGDGTFQPQVAFSSGPISLFAGDLNGDGKVDIVGGELANLPTGIVTLLNISPAPAPLTIVSAASFVPGPVAAESLATAFGNNLAIVAAAAGPGPLLTNLAETTVSIKDAAGTTRAAQLLYVSPKQVNFLVPAGTSAGLATVAPSLFTLNSDGLAAAYVVRVKVGNTQTIEPVFSLQNGMPAPTPINLGPPLTACI